MSTTKYDRLGRRYTTLVLVVFLLLFLVGLFFFWQLRSPTSPRLTIVVSAEPVLVWSWERKTGAFTGVVLSADTVIDAAGYGSYSLSSLWQLGEIEKKAGDILRGGLEEALAVPIQFFVGRKTPTEAAADPLSLVKEIFSASGFGQFLSGSLRTNLRVFDFLALVKSMALLRQDRVTLVTGDALTRRVTRPDGSSVAVLDPGLVDRALAPLFEDGQIRKEALRIAVVNASDIPGRAQQAGRLLSNMGGLVILLDTGSEVSIGCQVAGSESILKSRTAQFIASHFRCTNVLTVLEAAADIVVTLGRIRP